MLPRRVAPIPIVLALSALGAAACSGDPLTSSRAEAGRASAFTDELRTTSLAQVDAGAGGFAGDPVEGAGGSGGAAATGSGASTGGSWGYEDWTDPAEQVRDGAPPIVHCEQLYALGGLPRIDGLLEHGLSLETMTPVGWSSGAVPDGHRMRLAVAWHREGLCFYIEISDPHRNPANLAMPVWQGDAVELFVDHDAAFAPPGAYDSAGTKYFIVAAPGSDALAATRADVYLPAGYQSHWKRSRWLSVPTAAGYIVEAFVTGEDLGLRDLDLQPGSNVGFNLGHDISYPPGEEGAAGNREGQCLYKVAQPFAGQPYDYPFQNSSVFCTPTLLEPHGRHEPT
jgi:hypothetical protein